MVTALPEEAREAVVRRAGGGRPELHFLPDRASTFQYARKLAEIVSAEGAVILIPISRNITSPLGWRSGCRGCGDRRCKSCGTPIRTCPRQGCGDGEKFHQIPSHRLRGPHHRRRGSGCREPACRRRFPGRLARGQQRHRPEGATAASRPRAEVLCRWAWRMAGELLLLFGYEPLIKGVNLAFDMAATLTAEEYKIALGIVGTEKLRRYAEMCAAERPLPWLRLLAPQENVADLYQAAAVFLSPSRSEGLPYSVCEAMANGLPVVLSDIPTLAFAVAVPGRCSRWRATAGRWPRPSAPCCIGRRTSGGSAVRPTRTSSATSLICKSGPGACSKSTRNSSKRKIRSAGAGLWTHVRDLRNLSA